MKYLLPLLLVCASSVGNAAPSADDILEKAETIRNPQTDYVVDVELEDTNRKGETDKRAFQSLIKGRDKALVKFVKPEVDAGKKVLMVDNNMWVYMPQTAKPIRISPKQKLAGNAAYGDITRLNFIGNYDAKVKETLVKKGRKIHVLLLNARQDRAVTYSQIEYHVDAATFRPLLVNYQTPRGKILKSAYFSDYKDVLGVNRPTQMRIVDMLNKKKVTVLKFNNARKAQLPDIMFEKQNLGRS
jgi:outer membrane lipoprotein-sorting protein